MIALGICCMNRLAHLRETLPANIDSAQSSLQSGDCQILVLDYASTEEVTGWLTSFLTPDLRDKVLCYRTADASHWNAARAHNILVKQSQQPWFCNVDADNFIGDGFVEFLRDNVEPGWYLSALDGKQKAGKVRYTVAGRICVEKRVMEQLGGYNEDVYLDDAELRMRLNREGFPMKRIDDPRFLKAIGHVEKLENSPNKNWEQVRGQPEKARIRQMVKERRAVNPQGWGNCADLTRTF